VPLDDCQPFPPVPVLALGAGLAAWGPPLLIGLHALLAALALIGAMIAVWQPTRTGHPQ
jgi:hypothetical protein